MTKYDFRRIMTNTIARKENKDVEKRIECEISRNDFINEINDKIARNGDIVLHEIIH